MVADSDGMIETGLGDRPDLFDFFRRCDERNNDFAGKKQARGESC